jgi:HEAT repeat protein
MALLLIAGLVNAGEQNLFNGKDLTGWDYNPKGGWWHVEDGVLTAESTAEKPCKKGSYLIWKGGQPRNFELTADFRLSEKANSGIQFRTEARPNWNTYGYQADMSGNGNLVGFVYQHGRGLVGARGTKVNISAAGKIKVQQIGDKDELHKHYKKTEWNKYRIVCSGPDITLYVNGVLMCQVTDNDTTARKGGIIALQMHAGPPMKIQFKNIVLKDINREPGLIAVLKSDAEHREKADACRELAQIGTADAVPTLAAMLADEKLSHMARYALEPIPSPAVDDALRDALGKLKGLRLVGVIGSIGVRHDEKAIVALTAMLKDADTAVAQAAARALGNIGTEKASKALEKTLKRAEATNRLVVYEGLLQCAKTLSAKGGRNRAIAIYDSLRNMREAPHQVRAGALRGAVLLRDKDGLPLLMEAIRSSDYGLVQAAARIAMELKEADTSKMLTDELGKVSADKQVLLCNVLGKRADKAALPALFGLAKAGDVTARVAAIKAVAEIGKTGTAPALIELLKDPDGDIARTAESALAGLSGADVDETVIRMLDSEDEALKIKMISMVGQRRIAKATPRLLKIMADKDKNLRTAAIKSYGELAGYSELPELLGILVKETRAADISALEKAVGSICIAAGLPDTAEQKLVDALGKAVPEAKPAVLRTLRVTGRAGALKAVRAAVDDTNKDIHEAAIRVISTWRSGDAIPVLLELAKNSSKPIDKILCLRGYLNMAFRKHIPAKDRLAICRQAVTMIERTAEKRMLLGAIGRLENVGSLKLIIPYLDDPAVKNEAVTTVMAIVRKRPKSLNTPVAKKALEKVITAADKPAIVKEAKALLKQAGGK